ncbi:hypothetical protein SDC9_161497 [bioreactor metagenome]|uniref:Uncharacterized protein n=1 Tax=bioreactor metagenome TaxID=1076179 RepID=A0A645FIE3_9ZZZZ
MQLISGRRLTNLYPFSECVFIVSYSSSVNFPGFNNICSEIPILPISCSLPIKDAFSIVSSSKFNAFAISIQKTDTLCVCSSVSRFLLAKLIFNVSNIDILTDLPLSIFFLYTLSSASTNTLSILSPSFNIEHPIEILKFIFSRALFSHKSSIFFIILIH